MSHNNLEHQAGDPKLYVNRPVLLRYQAEYVLLNYCQKYMYRTTIAYLRMGSAFLQKTMKGHNQRMNGSDVMLTFLQFNLW